MRLHELEENKIYIGEDGEEYKFFDNSLCRIVLGGKYVVTKMNVLTQNFTPKKVKRVVEVRGWLNIYPGGYTSFWYATKESADLNAGAGRIACIEMVGTYEIEEGA